MASKISHRLFEASHGQSPRGFGAWAFIVMERGREVEPIFAPQAMRLTAAKTWARAHARLVFGAQFSAGFLTLEVAP